MPDIPRDSRPQMMVAEFSQLIKSIRIVKEGTYGRLPLAGDLSDMRVMGKMLFCR
jgi:hypothetical protein